MLSNEPGMHRWIWDLHYTGPDTERHSYPIAAVPFKTPRLPQGARALPGGYTVKLTVGDKSLTAPLTVRMDPRVKSGPAALQQLFQAETRLVSLMTQTTDAIREARSVVKQTGGLKTPLAEAADKQARAALAELAKSSDQIATLYTDIDSADVALTAAQSAAMAKVGPDLNGALGRWQNFTKTEIPALNQKLAAAGFAAIKVDKDEKEDIVE